MSKDLPLWLTKAQQARSAAMNPIVVHNNVEDELVLHGDITTVRQALSSTLSEAGTIVYSLAGWSFDSESTEMAFRRLCHLPLPPAKHPGDAPLPKEGEDPDVYAARFHEFQIAVDRYNEWQEVVEEGKKLGKTECQCLPEIPTQMDVAPHLIKHFLTVRPTPEAKSDDGEPLVSPKNYSLVIDWASFVMPADEGSGGKSFDEKMLSVMMAQLASMDADTPTVILVTPSRHDLSSTVYGRGTMAAVIDVPYPEFGERLQYLKKLKVETDFKLNGCTLEQLAHLASGLSNRHLRSLAAEAKAAGTTLSEAIIGSRKQEILSDELDELVNVIQPKTGFELIGGLEQAKEQFFDVVRYIREEKTPLVPMGILLVGPPGTGKTVLAEAFAKEVGYNFITPGNIKSKWVGESERNQHKVFEIAEDLAPVVLFYDEIDQMAGRGTEGDAGVSKEMFGAMLRFMSNTNLRGRVLVIGASNRPDLIDTAMKRPGRFDIRIPVLFPDEEERRAIFNVMFEKYDLLPSNNVNFKALAEATVDFSGADIECVVLEAARLAERVDHYPEVGMGELKQAVEEYIVHHDRKSIEEMEMLAVKECNSIRFLPERYRSQVVAAKEPTEFTLNG